MEADLPVHVHLLHNTCPTACPRVCRSSPAPHKAPTASAAPYTHCAARFNVELPATAVFDYPSVAALATYLASRLPPTVGDASGDVASGEPAWLFDDEGRPASWQLAPTGYGGGGLELITDLVGTACLYPVALEGRSQQQGGLWGFWAAAAAGANLQSAVPHQVSAVTVCAIAARAVTVCELANMLLLLLELPSLLVALAGFPCLTPVC